MGQQSAQLMILRMSKKKSYEAQIEELESIIDEIENEEIAVDVLAEKVKRAAELIRNCQQVLKNTESEVSSILKDLNKQ